MGGITVIIYISSSANIHLNFVESFMKIKYRGPDDTSYVVHDTIDINNLYPNDKLQIKYKLSKDEIRKYVPYKFILGYHRLIVNDDSYNASQPFEDPIMNKISVYPELRSRPKRQLLCNGEIYNYENLIIENQLTDRDLSSTCDVEIILPLYIKYGLNEMLAKLDGEFTFVLTENIETYDLKTLNTFAVKDIFGLKSLYYVHNDIENISIFVSEIKALPNYIIENTNYRIEYLQPGHYWSFQDKKCTQYYNFNNVKCTINKSDPDTLESIYHTLSTKVNENIISRHYLSQKSVGILLSGGFGSCLITSLLVKYLISLNEPFELHVFTINNDINAIEIIDFLEKKYNILIHNHTIDISAINICIEDINNIIYQLETYDTTTIREAIPFYYLMKYIKENTKISVLLAGDGLNEIFGGYSQFNNYNDAKFQSKTIQLLSNMYKYSLLRIDKISNLFSIEVRLPFLEKSFVEYVLSLSPALKRPTQYSNSDDIINKYIIRKAFQKEVIGDEILPDSLLWNKHAPIMSSFNLIDYFNNTISDIYYESNLELLIKNKGNCPLPTSKEEMYYRLTFTKYYPTLDYILPKFWTSLFF